MARVFKQVISSPTKPTSKDVLWVDSVTNEIKFFEEGRWQVVASANISQELIEEIHSISQNKVIVNPGASSSDDVMTSILVGDQTYRLSSGGGGEIAVDIVTNTTVGGISSGSTISSGTTLQEFAEMLTVTYKNPSISTFSRTGASVFEKDVDLAANALTFTVTYAKGTNNVASVKVYRNGTEISVGHTASANGTTFTFKNTACPASENKANNYSLVYKVVVTDTENRSTEKSITIPFYWPTYCGQAPYSTNGNVTSLAAMRKYDKYVMAKTNFEHTYTDLQNEYLICLIPSTYSDFSKILNGMNIDELQFGNMVKANSTVTINNVAYKLYKSALSQTLDDYTLYFNY